MNRGLMGVLGLFLVVLWWLFFKPESEKSQPVIPPNAVDESVGKKSLSVQHKAHEQGVSNQAFIPELSSADDKVEMPGLSYLAVYRLYHQAVLCDRYYSELQRIQMSGDEFNYPEFMWEKVKKHMAAVEHQETLPIHEGLKQVADHHASECQNTLQVWKKTFDERYQWENVYQRFLKVLEYKKPKTDKEKTLKKLIQTAQQVKKLFSDFAVALEGENVWTDEQLFAAKQKIKALRKMIIRENLEDPMVKVHNKDINSKIGAMYKEISAQKVTNLPKAKKLVNDVGELLKQTTKHLGTKDPDVFLLAKMITELNPSYGALGMSNYERLSEVPGFEGLVAIDYELPLMSFLSTVLPHRLDQYLYYSTLRMADRLYYCALGADCGEYGNLMTVLCLGLNHGRPELMACGANILESGLYQQLTAGQLYDIEWMLSALAVFYAE